MFVEEKKVIFNVLINNYLTKLSMLPILISFGVAFFPPFTWKGRNIDPEKVLKSECPRTSSVILSKSLWFFWRNDRYTVSNCVNFRSCAFDGCTCKAGNGHACVWVRARTAAETRNPSRVTIVTYYVDNPVGGKRVDCICKLKEIGADWQL